MNAVFDPNHHNPGVAAHDDMSSVTSVACPTQNSLKIQNPAPTEWESRLYCVTVIVVGGLILGICCLLKVLGLQRPLNWVIDRCIRWLG